MQVKVVFTPLPRGVQVHLTLVNGIVVTETHYEDTFVIEEASYDGNHLCTPTVFNPAPAPSKAFLWATTKTSMGSPYRCFHLRGYKKISVPPTPGDDTPYEMDTHDPGLSPYRTPWLGHDHPSPTDRTRTTAVGDYGILIASWFVTPDELATRIEILDRVRQGVAVEEPTLGVTIEIGYLADGLFEARHTTYFEAPGHLQPDPDPRDWLVCLLGGTYTLSSPDGVSYLEFAGRLGDLSSD
jgi:hypothetical protein